MTLGSWLGLDTSDDEEQDPVRRALQAMQGAGQGIGQGMQGIGQGIGQGVSDAASSVGRGLSSLVAPPTSPSPWDEPLPPQPQAPSWSALASGTGEALGAAARAELPAAAESLGPGILRPPSTMEEVATASMPAPVRAVKLFSDIGQAAGGELGQRAAAALGASDRPTLGVGPVRFSPQDVGRFVGGAALDPTMYIGGSEAVDRAVLGGLKRAGGAVASRLGEALRPAVEDVTPPVQAALQELGGGFVPRAARPEGIVPNAAPGERAAAAADYAAMLEEAGRPASSVKRWQALANAGVGSPDELVQRLDEVPLVSTDEARAMLGERPDYLDAVARFALEQRQKLLDGRMDERDVAKAYAMTLMSMRSAAQDADALEAKLGGGFTTGAGEAIPPNPQLSKLDALVSPHTGRPLGDIFTERTPDGRRIVRPESAGAAWQWTDEGQRALNAIQEGEFIPEAWDDLRKTRAAFGSDTIGGNGALRELTPAEVAAGTANLTNLSSWVDDMNAGIARLKAAGRESDIGDWLTEHARKLNGIGVGKSAFVKQLLGMGDAATIDAREINYWLSGRGLLSPSDRGEGAQLARAASRWWGSEPGVSNTLAPRIQDAIARLAQQYPELVEGVEPDAAGGFLHHWIWDKAGGSETAHRDLMTTMQQAGGVLPSLSPGGRAALLNAAQGAAFGAGTDALSSEAQGQEPDVESMLTKGAIGAGLGVLAGRAAARDVLGRQAIRDAATEASRMAAARDARNLAIRAPEAAGAGMVPEAAMDAARAALSPVARAVHDTYAAVTPRRVESSTARAQKIASDAIASRIPKQGGMLTPPAELVSQVHDALVGNLADSKVVMTGLRPGAIRAYLGGQGLTSKVDTGDLDAINRITQGQVNVGGKRAGQGYSLAQAAEFAQRESEQMRMATGGTRFPSPETGEVDTAAPRVQYAYVTDGQPLGGPNQPSMWLVWDDRTPRVTSAHHPYALHSRQDIHATMAPGLRAALWDDAAVAGGRVGPGIMEGGSLVEAAPGVSGEPARFGWEGSGVGVGDTGRTIADTHWLVGPEGEDAMRANGLLLSMPKEVQAAIARGELTDPEQIAAVLQRGGSPQWKGGWAATLNKSRSESLILDPDIRNVKAIYVTGGPDALDRKVPATAEKASQNLTVRDVADRMRREILDRTGQDVPIIHNDTTGRTARPMADATVVAGPPTRLAPGRAGIVDRYTRAVNPATGEPYTDIGGGFVPRLPEDAASRYDPRLAQQPVLPGMEPPPSRADLPAISDAPNVRSASPPRPGDVPEGVQMALGQSFPEAERALERVRQSGRPSLWEWARKVGYTGLIGPTSTGAQAIEGLVGAAQGTSRAVARAVAEGRPGDVAGALAAPIGAVPEGLRSLFEVLRGGRAPEQVAAGWDRGGPRMADRLSNPLARFAANALDYSTGVWAEAPDAFFSPIFRAIGEHERASQLARQTGASVDDLLEQAGALRAGETPRLRASPEAASIVDAGRKVADDLGMKGDPGKLGAQLQRWARRDDAVGMLASFLLPFPAMTARSLKATGRLIPGVGELVGRSEGRGGFERAHDQMLGAIGAAGLGYYASQGGITGSGPADPDARRALLAQGWQPNSVLIAGHYVPARAFGRWEPILGTIGEVNDTLRYGKPKDTNVSLIGDAARRIGNIATDQVGLSQLNDLLGVLDGGLISSGPGLAARSLTRYVPFGATLRAASSALDPEARRPIGWAASGETVPVTSTLQQLEQGVGLRSLVPPSRDPLGRPLANPQRGLAPEMTPDPMLRAFGRAGASVGTSAPTVKDPLTGTERALSPAQQARFEAAYGRALREEWSGYGNPTDADTIDKAKARARARALADVGG